MTAAEAVCLSCGMNVPARAVLPGSEEESARLVPSEDCARMCAQALTREYSDPAYFVVHRLTVAAYALQHPDTIKPHSVAVHLTTLCLAVGGFRRT